MNIFVNAVTATQTASNNRGEGDGSTLSTLQKVLTPSGDEKTIVKAEAIRWGMRDYLAQVHPENVNRTYSDDAYKWKDSNYDPQKYIDDDFFGFMNARAGRKRKGCFENTPAISLDVWDGDVLFSAKGGEKDSNSLHSCEVHHTAYQYGTALNSNDLAGTNRVAIALEALENLTNVGGNQSRFKFDFSPESVIIRVSNKMAPKIYGVFERINGVVECPKLIRLIQGGDIPAAELIIGGEIFQTESGRQLVETGKFEVRSVSQAFAEALSRTNSSKKETANA